MEFQCERGTNDFFLVQHRDRAMFHPHAPVAGRLVEELVTDLGEIVFDAQAPGERKVRFLGEGERAFLVQVGQGHVGQQPEVLPADVVPDVAVAAHAAGIFFSPSRDRAATHADGGSAGERFDDAKEGGGTVHAAVLFEARAEVRDPEGVAL